MQRIGRIKQKESYSPPSCHDTTHRSCHREESVIANQHDVEDRRGAEQVINYQPEFAETSPEDPSPRQHIGHVQGNAEGTCNQRGPLALGWGVCTPAAPRDAGPAPSRAPHPAGGDGRGPGAAGRCRGAGAGVPEGTPRVSVQGAAPGGPARCPPRRQVAAGPGLGGRGAPRGAALYLLGNPRWPG